MASEKLTMKIFAIDPGNTQSGWVLWDGRELGRGLALRRGRVLECGIDDNETVLGYCALFVHEADLAIEMIGHYGTGMPAGKEVFDTCVWIGRFIQAFDAHATDGQLWSLHLRPSIKAHLCGSARAKDGNVAQALRDRFGEKGTKANPGPFYGVKSHIWQAIALAVYHADTTGGTNED